MNIIVGNNRPEYECSIKTKPIIVLIIPRPDYFKAYYCLLSLITQSHHEQ